MNENIMAGKWKQLKGNIKNQWGKLTDDDVDRIEGNAEIAVGTLQEKYGWGVEEARARLNDWLQGHSDEES